MNRNVEIVHNADAKYGWYRYDAKFALPIYRDDRTEKYNLYSIRMLVRHSKNGKKYLYDMIRIKKVYRNFYADNV